MVYAQGHEAPDRHGGHAHPLRLVEGFVPLSITSLDGFRASGCFVRSVSNFRGRGDNAVLELLDEMDAGRGPNASDPKVWSLWIESIREAMSEPAFVTNVHEPPDPEQRRQALLVAPLHAFIALEAFIDRFITDTGEFGYWRQIDLLMKELSVDESGIPLEARAWDEWMWCLRKTEGHLLLWLPSLEVGDDPDRAVPTDNQGG
jgi:hypothetical protein